jgi:NADH dehydrogenase
MYQSLRILHERALHGVARTTLAVLSRVLSHQVGPQVKLH